MADIVAPMPNWQAPLLALQQQNSPVAQGQANLLQQQAQGQGLRNAMTAIQVGLYKSALSDFSGQTAQGAPETAPADVAPTIPLAPETPASASTPGAPAAAPTSGSDAAGDTASADPGRPSVAQAALLSGQQPGAGAGVTSQAPAQQAQTPSADTTDTTNTDTDGVDTGFPEGWDPVALRREFFVDPAGNQQSRQLIIAGARDSAVTGNPAFLTAAKTERDVQVTRDTAVAQRKANELYDTMAFVAKAPRGSALTALSRISQPLAARIEKEFPNDPQEQDAAARATAQHVAYAAYQYSGRHAIQGKDGQFYDAQTGMRLLGAPIVGATPAQYMQMSAKGSALVSVPQSDGSSIQEPLWKANGAPSLTAWVAQQANNARAQSQINADPVLGSVPTAPPEAVPALLAAHQQIAQRLQGANGPQPPQPDAPQQQPQQPQAAHPGLTASPAQAQYNMTMQRALADPEYRLQQPRVVSGQTATPAVLAQQQATVKSRAQLMQDAQAATQTAAQTLTYLTAAQAVINSPGHVPTGLSAGAQALIGRALQGTGASATDWASKYQEVAKFLSNAALQSARQTYGARMTQSEVKLQLENMNPNAHMTPAALKALIAENIRQSTYTLANARRVVPYLRSGNDPQSFAQWNQQYFPMQKIVNTPTKQTPAAGAKPPLMNAQGWRLMTDAQGRQAYVSPDGKQFARVQ